VKDADRTAPRRRMADDIMEGWLLVET